MKASRLLLILLLAGCTSHFDNVEYMELVRLDTILTSDSGCDGIEDLLFTSQMLVTYSNGTLSSGVHEIYKSVNNEIQQLVQRENPSEAYCQIKRQQLSVMTGQVLDTFGRRLK